MNDLFSLCPQPPSCKWTGQRSMSGSPGFGAWRAARKTRCTTPRATSGSTPGWCAEALAGLPAWRSLPEGERQIVFAAALLHDVAKPVCTRPDPDGRITSRGHSRRGAILARQILWRLGVPFAVREQIAALVRHHQVPYFLMDRPDARRLAIEVSQTARCDRLALLAEADVRGRVCRDQQRLLDNVALFVEFCREENCLSAPRVRVGPRPVPLLPQRPAPPRHAGPRRLSCRGRDDVRPPRRGQGHLGPQQPARVAGGLPGCRAGGDGHRSGRRAGPGGQPGAIRRGTTSVTAGRSCGTRPT